MEIHQIQTELKNPDFHYRLKAIAALNDYESEVAVPLLTTKLHDSEFLVRSFVARGLGNQQSAESFAALMQIMKFDDTPNVRAEAANSLSLFGRVAVSHLVMAFYQDDHWLVKRSILAAIAEMDCPEELFDICVQGLKDEDFTVQESSVDGLGLLANSSQNSAALSQILTLVNDESWRMRVRVSYALKRFDEPEAKVALNQLRKDEEHQVVGAALEDLLP
ncbi:HEAT repeat domain-containing protein [Nostoc sp. 'Peltigera membranacea cyanobiont' 232]|uniref:HEAT repeat domain-containing protein n=1 Tax=Nostoc sp. 'Peltigera membranacea cyanobiont' 232 TaxID=2014531 RepID=UPI000B957550|nr:HEAT repeat domain-containing protein [Nostoc sp. 'Peltigera membranacea cyanobiont' 232]OYE01825.1 phycocyanobilin lyase [Nostoc sp. 'Peltigera membranacea cyanobiont' 232]